MSFTGDFAKLRALRQRMGKLAEPETRHRLATVMGETARTQLVLGFRNGVNPYGEPWARLKRRKGKPLLDTGRLRSSFSANATATGFGLWSKTSYAVHHQYGTNGRRTASSRTQATDAGGRFLSHRKAGVKGGKNVVQIWVGFRRLNFKAGTGAIPPRMMVPSKERGFGNWREPLEAAGMRFIGRILRGK